MKPKKTFIFPFALFFLYTAPFLIPWLRSSNLQKASPKRLFDTNRSATSVWKGTEDTRSAEPEPINPGDQLLGPVSILSLCKLGTSHRLSAGLVIKCESWGEMLCLGVALLLMTKR